MDSILFPTDLGQHAEFATQYALSVAQENHAALALMHVIPLDKAFQSKRKALVTEAYRNLRKIVPPDANDVCKPELVRGGRPFAGTAGPRGNATP